MRVFRKLLLNSLLAGVMTNFVWFALVFWVYLETRSVVATSVLGGAYAVFSAVFGMLFGTYVDHHRKHTAMMLSSAVSLVLYALALLQYWAVGSDDILRMRSVHFWVFVALVMGGSMMANLRAIALSTSVTMLVEEDRRDRANGMVGTALGISFTVTSVISGLAVGQLGMGWAQIFTIVAIAGTTLHLLTIHVPEEPPAQNESEERPPLFDYSGAMAAIRRQPGLLGLIGFAALNNLLGGVFMSLLDAYGLSLVSVEVWGFVFAGVSLGFIVGGAYVAKKGLGSRPMRVIVLGNLANWTICTMFTLRPWIVLLALGMFVWMMLMPVIEAAEQTVLQQVVPFEQQGRVFGFAQTVENAASPLTAFMIGPIAEVFVIPFMTDGAGADSIGDWFGRGEARGLALIFTGAGVIGILATLWARRSGWFRSIDGATNGTPSVPVPSPAAV